jgi:hypothetical protein
LSRSGDRVYIDFSRAFHLNLHLFNIAALVELADDCDEGRFFQRVGDQFDGIGWRSFSEDISEFDQASDATRIVVGSGCGAV